MRWEDVVKWPSSREDMAVYLSWLVRFDGYIDVVGYRIELYDASEEFLRELNERVVQPTFGKSGVVENRGSWFRLRVYGLGIVRRVLEIAERNTWTLAAALDAEGTMWIEDGKYLRIGIYNKRHDFIATLRELLEMMGMRYNLHLDRRYGVYRIRISDQASVLRLLSSVGVRHPKFKTVLVGFNKPPGL